MLKLLPARLMPAAESTDKVAQSFLAWLANESQARHDQYTMYREYYDGDHDTALTTRQQKYLQLKLGQEFNTNYCPLVIDALAERLNVTGFDAGEVQSAVLGQWWQANRMDGQQGVVHTAAIRDGDAYLLVEWDADNNRPSFSFELASDGNEGVDVHYADARQQPVYASKRWRVTLGPGTGYVRRVNLYYPNRIEKYFSDERTFEGHWQPWRGERGEEPWPLWWTRDGTQFGEPLGLPVIHFKNAGQGYNYGQSEIKNVIPLQNALNKSIIDLLAAADTTAFRILWMLGDDPSSIQLTPGAWIYSTRPPSGENGVAVGMFPSEDLTPLITLKDSFAVEIARISRTPLSYFQLTGAVAAEGTLKQQESGLTSRAQNRCVTFGNSWEDALALARRLWNAFGEGPELDEAQPIETQWADTETRNEESHWTSRKLFWEAAKLASEVIPIETFLRKEANWTDEDLKDMGVQKMAQIALEQEDVIEGIEQ